MYRASRQLPLFAAVDEKPDPVSGFSVRESARAKRLSIKVFPRGKVEVVVPRRTRPKDVRSFVELNRSWIEETRRSFQAEHEPESFALPDAVSLAAINKIVEVRYLGQPDLERVRYRLEHGRLVLRGKVSDENQCLRALKRWLASTARATFEPQLRAMALGMETPFGKLQVRCQRSCWGSRSTSGTLSLNLCLLFLEPELTRYLMVHELCHGRHMNHSRRFWRLVERFEPDYRELDRRLGESWRQVPAWMGVY